MSFEKPPHPNEYLHPPPQGGKGGGRWWLWWVIGAVIAAFIFLAVYRRAWLEKLGVHVALGSGPGGVSGPSFPEWRPQ